MASSFMQRSTDTGLFAGPHPEHPHQPDLCGHLPPAARRRGRPVSGADPRCQLDQRRQRGFPPFEFLLVERDIKELKNMRAKTKQRYRSQFLDAGNRRCPLCLREFGDDVIPTLEHVPPAAIDGRALCLTCEDCNGPRAKHLDTALIDKSRGVVSGTIALLEIGMRAFNATGITRIRPGSPIDFFSERAQGEIREHLTLSFRSNKQ